ncbi:MAG: hypothetical protein CL607_15005 [Anaerolineaceae bacterium]|nr:hypothetical protein [Anaerolineaceae bacterium]
MIRIDRDENGRLVSRPDYSVMKPNTEKSATDEEKDELVLLEFHRRIIQQGIWHSIFTHPVV